MNRQSTEGFSGSETTTCDATKLNMGHYIAVKTHRKYGPRSERWCELCAGGIAACHAGPSVQQVPSWKKTATGEPVQVRGLWELSVHSAQFCCETGSALINKVH